jgi:peroxin-3
MLCLRTDWNTALARSFVLLYTLALLSLLTRVQLNLLGRKNYLSSVVALSERDNDPTIRLENHESDGLGADMATNRQYLTFSWWLLHKGWRQLLVKIDEAVKQVFRPYVFPIEDPWQKIALLTSEDS